MTIGNHHLVHLAAEVYVEGVPLLQGPVLVEESSLDEKEVTERVADVLIDKVGKLSQLLHCSDLLCVKSASISAIVGDTKRNIGKRRNGLVGELDGAATVGLKVKKKKKTKQATAIKVTVKLLMLMLLL